MEQKPRQQKHRLPQVMQDLEEPMMIELEFSGIFWNVLEQILSLTSPLLQLRRKLLTYLYSLEFDIQTMHLIPIFSLNKSPKFEMTRFVFVNRFFVRSVFSTYFNFMVLLVVLSNFGLFWVVKYISDHMGSLRDPTSNDYKLPFPFSPIFS